MTLFRHDSWLFEKQNPTILKEAFREYFFQDSVRKQSTLAVKEFCNTSDIKIMRKICCCSTSWSATKNALLSPEMDALSTFLSQKYSI